MARKRKTVPEDTQVDSAPAPEAEVIAPVDPDAELGPQDDEPSEEAASEDAPPREPPVILVRSNAIHCPFCRETVDAKKKNWVACASCLARHHKKCWRESKKCATCGLKKHLVAPGAMSVPAPGSMSRARSGDRGRLLSHEGHVKAIAFWNCFGGALLGLAGVLLMLAASGTGPSSAGIVGFFMFAIAGGLFACGVALWGFVGWARWATLALNLTGVVLALIVALDEIDTGFAAAKLIMNVAWSAATLWVLTCSSARIVFDARYQELARRDRSVKPAWYASPFFWVPWILVIAGFLFGLSAGSSHPHYVRTTPYGYHSYGRGF